MPGCGRHAWHTYSERFGVEWSWPGRRLGSRFREADLHGVVVCPCLQFVGHPLVPALHEIHSLGHLQVELSREHRWRTEHRRSQILRQHHGPGRVPLPHRAPICAGVAVPVGPIDVAEVVVDKVQAERRVHQSGLRCGPEALRACQQGWARGSPPFPRSLPRPPPTRGALQPDFPRRACTYVSSDMYVCSRYCANCTASGSCRSQETAF